MKNPVKNQLFTLIVLATIFQLFAFVAIVLNSDISISTVSTVHNNNIYALDNSQLVLSGTFRSNFDNVGIVQFRSPIQKYSSDRYELELYDMNGNLVSRSFIAPRENTLTFGLPVIEQAINQDFSFKLKAVGKYPGKFTENPLLITKGQVSKSRLLSDKKYLLDFVVRKVSFAVLDPNFFNKLYVCMLPYILILVFHAHKKSRFSKHVDEYYMFILNNKFILIPFILVAIDSFILTKHYLIYDGVTSVVAFYAFYNANQRVTPLFFYIGAFLIFNLGVINLIAGQELPAVQLSYWTFVFLIGGVLTAEIIKLPFVNNYE